MAKNMTNGRVLTFRDFLQFLNQEHNRVSLVSGANGANRNEGRVFPKVAKVALTEAARQKVGTNQGRQAQNTQTPGGNGNDQVACSFCKKGGHGIHECRGFAAIDVTARRDALGAARLCFRCFNDGHMARECDRGIRCSTCNRAHNTLLCQGDNFRRTTLLPNPNTYAGAVGNVTETKGTQIPSSTGTPTPGAPTA